MSKEPERNGMIRHMERGVVKQAIPSTTSTTSIFPMRYEFGGHLEKPPAP